MIITLEVPDKDAEEVVERITHTLRLRFNTKDITINGTELK